MNTNFGKLSRRTHLPFVSQNTLGVGLPSPIMFLRCSFKALMAISGNATGRRLRLVSGVYQEKVYLVIQ